MLPRCLSHAGLACLAHAGQKMHALDANCTGAGAGEVAHYLSLVLQTVPCQAQLVPELAKASLAAFCHLACPLAFDARLAVLEGMEPLARLSDCVLGCRRWFWTDLAPFLKLAEPGLDPLLGEPAIALSPLAFAGPRGFLALLLVMREVLAAGGSSLASLVELEGQVVLFWLRLPLEPLGRLEHLACTGFRSGHVHCALVQGA